MHRGRKWLYNTENCIFPIVESNFKTPFCSKHPSSIGWFGYNLNRLIFHALVERLNLTYAFPLPHACNCILPNYMFCKHLCQISRTRLYFTHHIKRTAFLPQNITKTLNFLADTNFIIGFADSYSHKQSSEILFSTTLKVET